MTETNKIILLTGVMAAGKSTLAQALAEKLPDSVHLRGDVFRKMIVNGRADMSASPSAAALQQLHMRYQLARNAAQTYLEAGFTVVYQDVVIGPLLADVAGLYAGLPLHIFVLNPTPEVVAQREAGRGKVGYHSFDVSELQDVLASTPRLGFWLDNSTLSVAETVEEMLRNLAPARVS